MKLLITGASGFVGACLMRMLPGATAAPSLRSFDTETLKRCVEEADAVIHTAAVSDIGACENDPEISYRANVLLPVEIAKACGARKLVCFSSDQVYSGSPCGGPYTEDDACPSNLYSRQKLEMENRVLETAPHAVMLRAEWMYDHTAPKMNIYRILMEAENDVCFDPTQYRGVTYVKEVAEAMPAVLRLPGGAYNFGSETTQPIARIADDFLKTAGRRIHVAAGPSRHNLWMDCSRARNFGVRFSDVAEGLRRCLNDDTIKNEK